MMQKLEKLLDLMIAHYAAKGNDRPAVMTAQLPLPLVAPRPVAEVEKKPEPAKPAVKEKKSAASTTKQDAADILADVEAGGPAPKVYEKITERKLTPEEALPLALTTAKEFVQRFQKATPDGLSRLRLILAEVYKVEKISQMKHEARLELIARLEREMSEVSK